MINFFVLFFYRFVGHVNQTGEYQILPPFGFGKINSGAYLLSCDIEINCQFLDVSLYNFPNYPSLHNIYYQLQKGLKNQLKFKIKNFTNRNAIVEPGTWFPVVINTAPRYICYNISLLLLNQGKGNDIRDFYREYSILACLTVNTILFIFVLILYLYKRKIKVKKYLILLFTFTFLIYAVTYAFKYATFRIEKNDTSIYSQSNNFLFFSFIFEAMRLFSMNLSGLFSSILTTTSIFYGNDISYSKINIFFFVFLFLIAINNFLMSQIYFYFTNGIYFHQFFFVFSIIFVFNYFWSIKQTFREAFLMLKIYSKKNNKEVFNELRNKIIKISILGAILILSVVGSSLTTYVSFMKGGENVFSFIVYDACCFIILAANSIILIIEGAQKKKSSIGDLLIDKQVGVFTIFSGNENAQSKEEMVSHD
ncbi:hypothetical protein TRFO_13778 [Tritrichomonas foetus]|uniref:Intimal thickness related receptor IRP domain-containing protein n=1 Tax=Tritrichomonas foetus TaxID=1144522 RepID=A0A1J4KX80_9EUKA|nr:hypothetical protein TRFO_13778 [Tritrichomonas foetus]|eukprot:OHT15786.1 hypothetical protein TRFO_13778 [Tritrichomonas foetus]